MESIVGDDLVPWRFFTGSPGDRCRSVLEDVDSGIRHGGMDFQMACGGNVRLGKMMLGRELGNGNGRRVGMGASSA